MSRERELWWCFLLQAEDGIRDLVRSRGLGDVYKRQHDALLPLQLVDRVGPAAGRDEGEVVATKRRRRVLSLIHI